MILVSFALWYVARLPVSGWSWSWRHDDDDDDVIDIDDDDDDDDNDDDDDEEEDEDEDEDEDDDADDDDDDDDDYDDDDDGDDDCDSDGDERSLHIILIAEGVAAQNCIFIIQGPFSHWFSFHCVLRFLQLWLRIWATVSPSGASKPGAAMSMAVVGGGSQFLWD